MDTAGIIEAYILEQIMMADKGKRIAPNESLLASGIIDSLSLLRLVSFVEERFGITVDDDDVVPENFETIAAVASYVDGKK